jgi:hypothetical protein
MDESIDVDARRPVVLFTDHDASFAKTREPDRQMTLRGADRFRVSDQKLLLLSVGPFNIEVFVGIPAA